MEAVLGLSRHDASGVTAAVQQAEFGVGIYLSASPGKAHVVRRRPRCSAHAVVDVVSWTTVLSSLGLCAARSLVAVVG